MTCEEIVKKLAQMDATHAGDGYECVFCGAYAFNNLWNQQALEKHEPDCIWRAAKKIASA